MYIIGSTVPGLLCIFFSIHIGNTAQYCIGILAWMNLSKTEEVCYTLWLHCVVVRRSVDSTVILVCLDPRSKVYRATGAWHFPKWRPELLLSRPFSTVDRQNGYGWRTTRCIFERVYLRFSSLEIYATCICRPVPTIYIKLITSCSNKICTVHCFNTVIHLLYIYMYVLSCEFMWVFRSAWLQYLANRNIREFPVPAVTGTLAFFHYFIFVCVSKSFCTCLPLNSQSWLNVHEESSSSFKICGF